MDVVGCFNVESIRSCTATKQVLLYVSVMFACTTQSKMISVQELLLGQELAR